MHQVRFVRMSFRSVRGQAGPGVPPAARPACGGWPCCLCVSSRAREEGALCRTLSGNTTRGVPVSGLRDPGWVPRGGGRGPAGPPAHSGAALGLRGPAGEAAVLGGGLAPSPQPLPRQPCCQVHLVPGAAVGLCLRFPCELVFLIFHCLPQLIELNL